MSANAPETNQEKLYAWDQYRASDEYQNSLNWAAQQQHLVGSMWAAFDAGYIAGEKSALNATGNSNPSSPRILFCSPVTGMIERGSSVWGGSWYDANLYAAYYTSGGKAAYHTGADLNMPGYADSGKPVYASASGVIVYAGKVSGWQGEVVTIKHTLEDSTLIWTRYAHIKVSTGIMRGVDVVRGTVIGVIADYNRDGPQGDHLHFDVAVIDLGLRPGDWPGIDKPGLLRDYKRPADWLAERRS